MVRKDEINKNLNYRPTVTNDTGTEVVVFDEMLVRKGSERWNLTASGYFVGYKMPPYELRYNIRRMWGKFGVEDIIVNNDAWSVDGISALASSLGNPLIMDTTTAAMCHNGMGRLDYARVLVEWWLIKSSRRPRTPKEEEDMKRKEEALSKLKNDNMDTSGEQDRWKKASFRQYNYKGNGNQNDTGAGKNNEGLFGNNFGKILWKDLYMHKRASGTLPWAIMGDMNVTFKVEEHLNGGSSNTEDMQYFIDCVNQVEVDDIGSYAVFQPFLVSDHSPVIHVIPHNCPKKPKSFRFANYTADKPEFINEVINGWKFPVEVRVEQLRIKLIKAQAQVEKDPYNMDIKSKAVLILDEYNEAMQDEEKLLAQKAEVDWLTEGDKNSSFFYKVIKGRRSRNRVFTICDKEGNYFEEAVWMVRNVTDDEVKDAMFDIGDNRAPGPDGYTSMLFKKAWKVIGKDVRDSIKEFFISGQMLGEWNATLISLVPKCIKKLVKINQGDFIPERLIQDNILLSQEILRGYGKRNRAKRCAMKIDLQKAYDTVSWNFLEFILGKFGFHDKMLRWIMKCVKTAGFSICINGERDSAKGKAKIAWKQVCKPKEYGGLGLKNLKVWNEALLTKHLWNIAAKKDTLWNDSGLLINLVTHKDLYDARIPKMIKLADMIHDNAWKWPISWIYDELDVINIMVPRLRDGFNDNVKWISIDDSLVPFHTKEVMKTQDKVMQWGKQSGLLCPLCNTTNDSHRHLFFMCDYSNEVWKNMAKKINLKNISYNWMDIVDELIVMKNENIWNVVRRISFAAVVYFIWQERNQRIFRNEKRTVEKLHTAICNVVKLKLMNINVKDSKAVRFPDVKGKYAWCVARRYGMVNLGEHLYTHVAVWNLVFSDVRVPF
nr:hypothetical protein [Tanacetum cinerariifolium]